MADVLLPWPDKILNYPRNGELKHLFRKELTSSDMERGLILSKLSNFHLRNLLRPLLDDIARGALMVWCYAPAIHRGCIVLINSPAMTSYFWFLKLSWDRNVVENRFLVGQEIICWYLYDAEDGPHSNLSFLIQPVGNYVVPQEAASGGTETSTEAK